MPEPVTYYEVLVISKTASTAEIKAAWKKLAKVYHPDLLGGVDPSVRQASEAKFKEINEAYRVLSNPARRTLYDQRWGIAVEQLPASRPLAADLFPHSQPLRRHRHKRSVITPRAKAFGVLIAVALPLCWLIAYFVISAGSPKNRPRTLPSRKGTTASARAAANNVTRDGCLHSSTCAAYRILTYDDKLMSRSGHAGLFVLDWTAGRFSAYCDDSGIGDEAGGCSKFTEAVGKTIWLDNARGTPCWYFDQQLWIDQEGDYHQGHVVCLTVVSKTDSHSAVPTIYKLLSYDASGDSKDRRKGLFTLQSKTEILKASCESGTTEQKTDACSKLAKLVGVKVLLVVNLPDRNSLCFDRDANWRMNEHGEYHLEDRECLRVIDRHYAF